MLGMIDLYFLTANLPAKKSKLIAAYLICKKESFNVKSTMNGINRRLNTNYGYKVWYDWKNGQKPMPTRVKDLLRYEILEHCRRKFEIEVLEIGKK